MSCQKLRSDALRLSAVILMLATAASAAAQGNEPADKGDAQQAAAVEAELAADEAAEAAIADQEDVPAKGESDAARRLRDEKALLGEPGVEKTKSPQEKAALEAERALRRHQELLQQRQQALSEEQRLAAERQFDKAKAEYERALKQRHPELEQAQAAFMKQLKALEQRRDELAQYERAVKQRHPELEQQMKKLEYERVIQAQQDAYNQAILQMEAMRQQQQSAPLPKDGTFQVYPLRYGQATDAAQILSKILGGTPMRMAVDDRTNSLLIFADKDTTEKVRSLVENLDARPADDKEKKAMAAETLQLRFVWLLDGIEDEGQAPPAALVGDQVIEAIEELGFEDPKVVCQQVTTLTLNEGRLGKFNFQVPVLIESQPWQFDGGGQIESLADERFNLRFDLQFQQDGRDQAGQLGGAINTPKGHYTVMGTTTFVATSRTVTEDGTPKEKQQQHLSAFVVYLDRAQSFPGGSAPK